MMRPLTNSHILKPWAEPEKSSTEASFFDTEFWMNLFILWPFSVLSVDVDLIQRKNWGCNQIYWDSECTITDIVENYVRLCFHPQNQGHNKSFIKEYKYMASLFEFRLLWWKSQSHTFLWYWKLEMPRWVQFKIIWNFLEFLDSLRISKVL